MYITLRTVYKTTFPHLHVHNHFCYSPQVCLNDKSTGKYDVNTQIHESTNMNIKYWQTLPLPSLNHILALTK